MATTTTNLLRRMLGANTWLGRMLRVPRDFLPRDTVAKIRQEQKPRRKVRQDGGVLHVPERFNKNSAGVRAMGTPAQTGTMLIKYMCERLSVADLGDLDVLDFGAAGADLPMQSSTIGYP